jgi:GNAT superfamily N-acetyltransferase
MNKPNLGPVPVTLASEAPERDRLAVVGWVTSGRSSLKCILGDKECRHRLLKNGINWDRVLIGYDGITPVGYAAFKHSWRGPFSPGIRPFIAEFGGFNGVLRYSLFMISEWREWYYGFYLYGLRVRKIDQRQGVGSALLKASAGQALCNAYQKIELEVQVNNHAAIAFYNHHGFTPIRTLGMSWLGRLLSIPPVINLRRTLPLPSMLRP